MRASPKLGMRSASTTMVNDKVAASASMSVAVHVNVVAGSAAVGVPESVRVAGSRTRPAGGSGVSA